MLEARRTLWRVFLSQEMDKLIEQLENEGDDERAQETHEIRNRLRVICTT